MNRKLAGFILSGILAVIPARGQDPAPAPVAKTKAVEKTTTKTKTTTNTYTKDKKTGAVVASTHTTSTDEEDDREAEAQEREAERKEREQERRDQIREREQERIERIEETYDSGMEALDEGRWEKALRRFDDVAQAGGPKADAALYWKAYSLNKLGRRDEASSTIADLRKNYPKSRWVNDAGALEIEVKKGTGQAARPEDTSDCELKLLAINGLMTRQSDDAVPILETFLKGSGCPKAKRQALFVLAQSNSTKARDVMASIARGNSNPQLQRQAIEYLGIHGVRRQRTSAGLGQGRDRCVLARLRHQSTGRNGGAERSLAALCHGDFSRGQTENHQCTVSERQCGPAGGNRPDGKGNAAQEVCGQSTGHHGRQTNRRSHRPTLCQRKGNFDSQAGAQFALYSEQRQGAD
ncbi:MAG: hypothetical protein HY046_06390 [Acidobacteria bacterium]|nr:hypothetical protein [Acidobacteriota bacterium]